MKDQTRAALIAGIAWEDVQEYIQRGDVTLEEWSEEIERRAAIVPATREVLPSELQAGMAVVLENGARLTIASITPEVVLGRLPVYVISWAEGVTEGWAPTRAADRQGTWTVEEN